MKSGYAVGISKIASFLSLEGDFPTTTLLILEVYTMVCSREVVDLMLGMHTNNCFQVTLVLSSCQTYSDEFVKKTSILSPEDISKY
jgi:hypothetical protein